MDTRIIDVKLLRKAMGVLGVLFPFSLWFGGLIGGTPLQPSMSAYYHTQMHDAFVAFLCAIGLALFAYQGYTSPSGKQWEKWVSRVAGLLAAGTAIFHPPHPGQPPDAADLKKCVEELEKCWKTLGFEPLFNGFGDQVANGIHFISAIGFLGILTWFAHRFRKTGDKATMCPGKRIRNRIYAICKGAMCLAGVAAIAGALLKPPWPVTFFGQAVAIWAFGVAWFVKGLRDRRERGARAPEGRQAPSSAGQVGKRL